MRPRAAVPARFFLTLATLARRTACLTVAALAVAAPLSPAAAQPERRPYLFKDARGELAQARARGESEVVLVIASMPGRNARVAAAIEGMGGRVGFRADDVDYVRAWVPVERVEELVALGDVHSVDVSITGRPRSFGLAGGEAEAPALPAAAQSGELAPAEPRCRRHRLAPRPRRPAAQQPLQPAARHARARIP